MMAARSEEHKKVYGRKEVRGMILGWDMTVMGIPWYCARSTQGKSGKGEIAQRQRARL